MRSESDGETPAVEYNVSEPSYGMARTLNRRRRAGIGGDASNGASTEQKQGSKQMLEEAMGFVGMAFNAYDPSNEHMHQVVLSLMSGARRTLLNSDEETRESSTSLITGLAPLFSRDKKGKVVPYHKRWDEAICAALNVVECFFQHGDWGISGRVFDTIIASTETLESTIPYVETLGRRHKSHHPRTPGRGLLSFIKKLETTASERNAEIAKELRKVFKTLPPSLRALSEESAVEPHERETQDT